MIKSTGVSIHKKNMFHRVRGKRNFIELDLFDINIVFDDEHYYQGDRDLTKQTEYSKEIGCDNIGGNIAGNQ